MCDKPCSNRYRRAGVALESRRQRSDGAAGCPVVVSDADGGRVKAGGQGADDVFVTKLETGAGKVMASGVGEFGLDDAVLRSASVLVVDDTPANVALLTRLLRSAGVEDVHGVTDSREAVEHWRRTRADLVLLDLQMPHLDGFAVMASLRAAVPAGQFVPVLVLTADTAPTTRDRALAAGANDFLAKPFDRSEVVLRVRNLLHTRSLHADVQRHNAALTAELERRAERDERLSREHREIAGRVDTILAAGRLAMVFQPIFDLAGGQLVGVEALARFPNEPARPPDAWFQDAWTCGRGIDLELAAIRAATDQIDRVPVGAVLSVNASPATAVSPLLGSLLEGLPQDRIVLELTEHTQVEDYDALLTGLRGLRRRGVRIAVDDTGAGYAGLRHLLHVRPDIVKLDVALTRGVDTDPARRALAAGLVTFAQEIDAAVVAEGIETEDELQTLRTLGIGWGQGYHLARPGQLPPPGPRGSTGAGTELPLGPAVTRSRRR